MIQRLRTSGGTVPMFENRTGISRLTAHGIGGGGGRWKRRRRLCHTHTFLELRPTHHTCAGIFGRLESFVQARESCVTVTICVVRSWCETRSASWVWIPSLPCLASPCKRGAAAAMRCAVVRRGVGVALFIQACSLLINSTSSYV